MKQTLNPQFWRHFSKNIWERKPIVYPNLQSPLRQNDETRNIQNAGRIQRSCERSNALTVLIVSSGERQHDLDTFAVFLPRKKDLSLLGYAQRMQAHFPIIAWFAMSFCRLALKLENCFRISPDCFSTRWFSQSLFGARPLSWNYQKTPFGAHVDGCGVFSFRPSAQKNFACGRPSSSKKIRP